MAGGAAGLAWSLSRGLSASAKSPIDSQANGRPKSVILLWLAGGISHIDSWDVKPDAPREVRGPFATIPTSVPGLFVSEHLPRQAKMMEKFTIIRSVDCTSSNHQPNQVLQTGNLKAAPRVNPNGDRYPAIASVIARHHGANQPGMPPSVAFWVDRTHIAWAGYLGQQYDPFQGNAGPGPFRLPKGLNDTRVAERQKLLTQLDELPSGLDLGGGMSGLEQFGKQAADMVLGNRAREAFDINLEPAEIREAYNAVPFIDHKGLRGEQPDQVLMARRLVESGVSFVTVVLSAHRNSGTWDTHGEGVYGGIEQGLRQLLNPFDHLLTTLVNDLEERGMLDDVLVLAMSEFGRTPRINDRGGRDHWQPVGSIAVAGGGFQHGQVIGATDRLGSEIKERIVRPGDLAATIYHHMGVPLDATYLDPRGRPLYIVEQGELIRELLG